MNPALPIEIVGGGLAGLSLGLSLRREAVPVRLHEAGAYPRHRVCGEFIAGLRGETERRLGLGPFLADALEHREVSWFQGGELSGRQELPEPARAISRHVLDDRLAQAFVAAGGELRTGRRVVLKEARPGWINATGRVRSGQPWLGLKAHFRHVALDRGLEMHLGNEAYVGLCALPGGVTNVCGLFRRRFLPARTEAGALHAYLRACGLGVLADRLAATATVPGTAVAVAGLGFEFATSGEEVRLGDAVGMLPPFLGNGMAAAFQTAEDAVEPLLHWSQGEVDWSVTCASIRQRLERRLGRRRRWSQLLHPFLLQPGRQRWVAPLTRGPSLPLRMLYRILH